VRTELPKCGKNDSRRLSKETTAATGLPRCLCRGLKTVSLYAQLSVFLPVANMCRYLSIFSTYQRHLATTRGKHASALDNCQVGLSLKCRRRQRSVFLCVSVLVVRVNGSAFLCVAPCRDPSKFFSSPSFSRHLPQHTVTHRET